MYPSTSENHGLEYLTEPDQKILSVGISTAGIAEIKMAKAHKARSIVATTIDEGGALFTQNLVRDAGLSDQITVKVEDVQHPLPYSNGFFDFIYARLVLHYLPKEGLQKALIELYRILRTGGKFFVVVRSKEGMESCKDSVYDPETGLTSLTTKSGRSFCRFFHTVESIREFLEEAGFKVMHIKTYKEQLCTDYERKYLNKEKDNLIEVLAAK
jgi:ubiquinone/menaquinone biosynthesis C-methylase UbiE